MAFLLGSKSLSNMSQVHPKMVLVVKKAISISTMDFSVISNGGGRTAQEQDKLFREKVTTMDGYKKKSNHQLKSDGWGHAIDLIPYVKGKLIFDDWENYYPIASAMSKASLSLGCKIKWGGNWYETMDQYGSEVSDMKAAVVRYKAKHPGPDFIDGPHFELA